MGEKNPNLTKRNLVISHNEEKMTLTLLGRQDRSQNFKMAMLFFLFAVVVKIKFLYIQGAYFGYVDGMSYNLVENGGNLNDISNITYIYYPTLYKFLLSPIADMVFYF